MNLLKSANADSGSQALYDRLVGELESGKKVLWLIPGGSNIPISAGIMSRIDDSLTPLLSLALTDERYGDNGHPDSNWQQLDDIGFENKQATRYEVLHEAQAGLEATAAAYDEALQTLWQEQDIVIGQFGMGADGHIAGILPHSQAASSSDFVTGYHTDTFDRITACFPAISKCAVAYLFAFGSDKLPALQNLQSDIDLLTQPAQILKVIPQAYVFNDQIGDPA